ncbi:uncharacterized protein EDB93DRAFT_1267123 [Suillus bovinus]|uniref:uncharacterized protein n=1 Tax=Suillus bovinus TaxID=48563 RepID=UPI001B87136B|nr:uncharacterized protein EDB93DRAFT_1267123 [Suillus bovinus]KAG2129035.1 hypothetical protein EDB93DRAFT_1267123 [Suillus bovinus]
MNVFLKMVSLCKRIITAIKDADNVEEVLEFFNVSNNNYLSILDSIDEDGDEDKVICKLVYAEELRLLTATLPNQLHQAYLAPMSTMLLGAMGSIGIPYQFWQIHIQTDVQLLSAIGLKLGVPDMLMEYKDPDGDCIPLFMVKRKDLLAITSIDVKEVKRHAGPESGSEAADVLEECPSVSTFLQWLLHTATNSEDPTVMKMFHHIWQYPITMTITMWLHHPNGSFNVNKKDPDLCTTADLFPECDGLEDIDRVFQHTLERIRDQVISLIKVNYPREVQGTAFARIHAWSPPNPLNNWDLLADEVIVGTRQTGYTCYATCHRNILKRKAEEDEVTTGGSTPSATPLLGKVLSLNTRSRFLSHLVMRVSNQASWVLEIRRAFKLGLWFLKICLTAGVPLVLEICLRSACTTAMPDVLNGASTMWRQLPGRMIWRGILPVEVIVRVDIDIIKLPLASANRDVLDIDICQYSSSTHHQKFKNQIWEAKVIALHNTHQQLHQAHQAPPAQGFLGLLDQGTQFKLICLSYAGCKYMIDYKIESKVRARENGRVVNVQVGKPIQENVVRKITRKEIVHAPDTRLLRSPMHCTPRS